MRVYEELFIVKPDTPEEELDGYIGQVKDLITTHKGVVDKVDKWGTRKLAYRIAKCNEGIYTLIQFSAPADTVHEVERRMRVTDSVIKFITVRIDERLKKIEKRKKARAARAARKPAPVAPSMPAPAAVAPGEPAPAAVLPGMPGAPAPAAPAAPAPVAAEPPKKAEE